MTANVARGGRAAGPTNHGIGGALTRIATAILRDEHTALTVSTVVPEAMELGDVSLSVPVIVGREGVERVLPLRLSEEEDRALRRSAEIRDSPNEPQHPQERDVVSRDGLHALC